MGPGRSLGGHGHGAHPPGPGLIDGLSAPRGPGGRLRGLADDGALVQGQHPVLQGGAGWDQRAQASFAPPHAKSSQRGWDPRRRGGPFGQGIGVLR